MATNRIVTDEFDIPTETYKEQPETTESISLKPRIEQLFQRMFSGHGENYFDGF